MKCTCQGHTGDWWNRDFNPGPVASWVPAPSTTSSCTLRFGDPKTDSTKAQVGIQEQEEGRHQPAAAWKLKNPLHLIQKALHPQRPGRAGARSFVRGYPHCYPPAGPSATAAETAPVIMASCLALRIGLVSGGGEWPPLWPAPALEEGGRK